MILLIFALCPLLAAQVQPAATRIPWRNLAVYAAAEYDAATTYNLRNCQPCYEANPVMRPFARNISIFPVEAATAWVTNKFSTMLDRSGHERFGRVLQWSVIAAHTAAGSWNLTLH